MNKLKQSLASRATEINRLKELSDTAANARANSQYYMLFRCRYEHIDQILHSFDKHHSSILNIVSTMEDGDLDEHNEIRKEFENNYFDIKVIYNELFKQANLEDTRASDLGSSSSNVRLPKIKLPAFSGKYKDWPTFFDLFNSTIHNNHSLSNGEKYQYLLSLLEKEPLTLVKSVPATDDNYRIAYDTLIKRYQNIRSLATTYWDEISEFPKISSDSSLELRHLLDVFNENIAALKNLQFDTDSWDFILFQLLIKKLDTETITRYELQRSNIVSNPNTDIPKFSDLVDYLNKQCLVLNSAKMVCSKTIKTQKKNVSNPKCSSHTSFSRSSFVVTQNNSEPKKGVVCQYCKSDHLIYKCPGFHQISPKERYDFVKANRLCLNCFSSIHGVVACKSPHSCKSCSARHNTLLHFSKSNPQDVNTLVNSTDSQSSNLSASISNATSLVSMESPNNQTGSRAISNKTTVLLSTAVIDVMDFRGNFHAIRVLLDSASQANFLTESCAVKLGLQPFTLNIPINGVGLMTSTHSCGVNCKIRSRIDNSFSLDIEAVVLQKICAKMPNVDIDFRDWNHIHKLDLADQKFNTSDSIDMLLGADVYAQIIRDGRLGGISGTPTALNTIFGWILLGRVQYQPSASLNAFFTLVSPESRLDETLKSFWKVEEVSDVQKMSKDDELCEDIFRRTHYRNSSGRFVVSLPFKNMEPEFIDTRSMALRRLYSLERRLASDSSLKNDYAEFMLDYLKNGHMELIDHLDNNPHSFYIPHHAVLKPESQTTKLRVVFDCSAKSSQNCSLNDFLLVGGKLQKDIFSLMMDFRIYKYVLSADIKQMFRNILVDPRHQDYQRILWRFSEHEPVKDYRLLTVTYGMASSPFLANRVLLQLAEDEKSKFPEACSVLSTSIYVDDLLFGKNELSEAAKLKDDLIALLKSGGFLLRKWSSNHPDLLSDIPEADKLISSLDFDSAESNNPIKILGLRWCPSLDKFSYQVEILDRPCTKRNILSELSRIFDPLGFLSPLTFFAKYLIQYMWTIGLDWDATPPPDVLDLWLVYKRQLTLLSELQIPRLILTSNPLLCDIHGFCDSSEKGYASVIYFRCMDSNKEVKVFMICAKSKVAPLQKISLARLELCGAVLLANLLASVFRCFESKLVFNKIYAWSDSMIALTWIRGPSYKWKTFVSNRVSHIQTTISPSCWRHVRSKDNPADPASRGLLPEDLIKNALWWHGPPWLSLEEQRWPSSDMKNVPSEVFEEEKVLSLFVSLEEDCFLPLLDRFSSLKKIQRIVAYCLRFLHNLKNGNHKKNNSFSSVDLQEALIILVKRVQSVTFHEDIFKLKNGKSLSKPLRKLSPFLDSQDLLRVGGRLANSSLLFDQKHPLLLSRDHRLTFLLIEQTHKDNLHPGLQALQYLLVQNYWIIGCKRAIRDVVSKCLRCFRSRPKSVEPYMGNLPSARITQVKPFSVVGVDFAGPFLVTLSKARGIRSQKAYLCLFVCYVTKAVHLELASDLSSEAFLLALRRFIARRGRISTIHSDNGTNFHGANNYLVNLMKSAADAEYIEWKFNPPSAPHLGGLWEAGIKSVKVHFYRIIGQQILTFEEMSTLFCQIEAVLNSRPICALSSDPNDLNSLTPGHFLTLAPLTCLPEENLLEIPENRLNRWQLLQKLHQSFWRRWHLEYLHQLHQRQKWNEPGESVDVGNLVLIKDELAPPLQWRLGRITAIHPGTDGIVRVVTIKTATGTYKRPVVKICPLPNQA